MSTFVEISSEFKAVSKGSLTDAAVKIPAYEPLRSPSLGRDYEVTVADFDPAPLSETYGQQVIRPDIAVPVLDKLVPVKTSVFAAMPQIWEGIVIEVSQQSMFVKLRDRQGFVAEHTANIDLSWVVPQDTALIRPGAVFYWTLYKETKRSTIRHTQEIRFRRLPDWTKKQITSIYSDADALLAKFSQSTIAD